MSEKHEPRWYCVAKDGEAYLCTDEEDAEENAKLIHENWPGLGPHRAVQPFNLHKQLEIIRNGWMRVVDEEMVVTHLGVANEYDSYAEVKRKLNALICWHIDVATDPKLNNKPAD